MVCFAGLPESISFYIEYFLVLVGHSGVGVNKMLVNPRIMIFSVHGYNNNILLFFITIAHHYLMGSFMVGLLCGRN